MKTKHTNVDMELVRKAMKETGCSEQHAIELVANGHYPPKQETPKNGQQQQSK